MMEFLLLIAANATILADSPAQALQLAAGLVIRIEQIPDTMTVDGVTMRIQRVTGTGVPELASRIEAKWRREGSRIASERQGGWHISSRLQGTNLEVVQWRTSRTGPEMLWSALDVKSPVQPTRSTSLPLPPSCTWSRSVWGRSGNHLYVQRSARCHHTISGLSAQFVAVLPRNGWRIRSATDSALHVERPGEEGFISLSIQEGDSVTWLTWLQVETAQ